MIPAAKKSIAPLFVPRLNEKSRLGHQLLTAILYPGIGLAISHTAIRLANQQYDFCIGPLSTGYFRDSVTGLDYADQRYEQPGVGRFMTPDSAASAKLKDPGTWNKYAYTGGDPVNRTDRTGQDWEELGFWNFSPFDPFGYGVRAASERVDDMFLEVLDNHARYLFQPSLDGGLISDYWYDWWSGTADITVSMDQFANGFLGPLGGATIGAGSTGGLILLGGTPIGWTITVTGAVILTGVAIYESGLWGKILNALKKDSRHDSDSESDPCYLQYLADIDACKATGGGAPCYARATEAFAACRKAAGFKP